jgi:hypothetical protein
MNTWTPSANDLLPRGGATSTADFGTNLGEKLMEKPEVRQLVRAEREESGTFRLPVNVGRTEQKIRVVSGLALVSAAVFARVPRGWRIALATFGTIEIVTGTTRFCPLWSALGINTTHGGER